MVASTISRSSLRCRARQSFTQDPMMPKVVSGPRAQHSKVDETASGIDDVRSSELTKRRRDSADEDNDTFPPKFFHVARSLSQESKVREPLVFELVAIGSPDSQIQSLISDILGGFSVRVGPVAVDDGASGVYFLRTKAHRLAGVFKPADEEPFALNNPKVHRARRISRVEGNNDTEDSKTASPRYTLGIRSGIAPGSAMTREVAAYLLNHDRRAGVPPTTLTIAQHPAFFVCCTSNNVAPRKIGSLQVYIPHHCTADDVSETLIPVERVHDLAILDIRLANQDRHGGNLLVIGARDSRCFDIVPIDHGACLPRITNMDETSFVWLSWPQANVPFSEKAKTYISSLDGVRDAEELILKLPTDHRVESEALLTLVVCDELLRVCVLEFGMTAYETASLMCRQYPNEPSILEQIVRTTIPVEKLERAWSTNTAKIHARAFRQGLEAFLSARTDS